MLTIKCFKCKRPIFKYIKVGEGRLLRCYKGRIVKDYSVREGDEVRCQCGNLIGIDEGRWIKLKQSSFIRLGTVTRGSSSPLKLRRHLHHPSGELQPFLERFSRTEG